MAAELTLGFRSESSANLTTFTLDNVNLQSKVDELKNETAKRINLPKNKFELVYCGCLLEDDATLEFSGLKSGVMVHVLVKKEPEAPPEKKPVSEATIQRLASVFQTFSENPALRNAFYRLSKRADVIENIIASSPTLSDDPVAIAMLQDPILMSHFSDVNTIKRIAEQHPVLITVAQHTASAVHEEAHNNAASTSASSSMNISDGFPFSLDALSDGEDMAADSSQSESELAQQSNSSGITAAQLAMALSRAATRAMPASSSSSSSSRTGSNSGLITSEMFSQAMQQAFATTQAPSGAPAASPLVPQLTDMQRQLALMHEMGLQDDAVNIQALQFTNGDVQAAIELVFSGFNN